MSEAPKQLLPIEWMASAKSDLSAFPQDVKDEVGQSLFLAQLGETATNVKALQGFGGASVQEIRANDASGTYRTVYTVKFKGALYVLDAFQKKSTSGIKTARVDIDRIKARLKAAEQHYATHYKRKG
ncbi:type II toxin-antitoxin system RelE/ParE family toxin [Chelatococcus reniformis]|uniref:Addiction module toxin RelE n=1 Tax=Chelatococcus reniformis TaxID=1494448 RepID=A0A916XS10_9HYPH|nr:type II toxin-antitoxin system RelE/ParE family toxin [Chelatococcus reniformis]GGC94692.1 hypothetical protein GCM10010994_60550 [Chelatococcus reniformis]